MATQVKTKLLHIIHFTWMRLTFRTAAALGLAPIVTIGLFLALTGAPRHALLFGDPDFGYLFNSLLLADGRGPWHVDHPGTPLQWLGALLLRARYLGVGTEASLAADLIAHPLAYHSLIRIAGVILLLLSQAWCGWRLLRAGISLPLLLFAQLSPFLVWDGALYLARLSPETLLSAVGLLLLPFLAAPRRPILMGLLLALLATLKASTLPLLLCIFLLEGWRARGRALGAFLASYLIITIPIWPRLGWMFAWYGRVLQLGGMYGQEGAAFTMPHYLGVSGFLQQAGPLALALILLLGWALFAQKKQSLSWKREWPLAAAALVLLVLVLKHPAPRYLLALSPITGAMAIRLRSPLFEKILPIAVFLPALIIFPQLLLREQEVQARTELNLAELEEVLGKSYSSCHLAVLNDVAIPAFALYAGNLATDKEAYAEELREAFPRVSFRQGNLPLWRGFGGELSNKAWAQAARKESCVVALARRDGGAQLFEKIFDEPPQELASVGPYGFYKIFGLGSGASARVTDWGNP